MKSKRFTEADRSKYCPLYAGSLERKMPEKLAVLEIRVLMGLTASAMKDAALPGADRSAARGAGSEKGFSILPCRGTRKACLREYQRYTVSCLQNRSGKELALLRKAMYRKAFAAGRMLGKLPGMTNDAARTRLIRLLYKNIDIQIVGSMPGEITIPRCSFSRCYTPQMCAVMSGMDAGIICGIFGGGSLTFTRRLTEGCPACQAVYRRN
ncbi:MAG: hypothetical protein IJ198_03370 [Lachnospiraceae bacterium]|nr:hypothetical protein [Lachnospiraceae bacterium]